MDESAFGMKKKFKEPAEDQRNLKFKQEKKIFVVSRGKENSEKKVFKDFSEKSEKIFKKEEKEMSRKINFKYCGSVSFLFSRPCCELIKLPKSYK